MPFHQVLVSATPGDAITNAAIELRDLLRLVGPSDIYALNIHSEMIREVHPLHRYSLRRRSLSSRQDIILFHASIGQPTVFKFISERPERIVLVYHNISPSQAFLPYDPAFAGLLDGGRRELEQLRDKVVMALAVSEYNAKELLEIGYHDVRVARLIVDPELLRYQPVDERMAESLQAIDGPVAMFVGQLLPHKRPDLLLQAFHILSTYLLPEVSLMMVGANRLPSYGNALVGYRRELNLHRVHMLESLSLSELVAIYRRADCFATASEHEGFCVPLLEAMAFEVPIVARGYAAIPETVADAGLVLPEQSGAAMLAEAMAEVLTNGPLRSAMTAAGTRRLGELDPERAKADVLEHLLSVV